MISFPNILVFPVSCILFSQIFDNNPQQNQVRAKALFNAVRSSAKNAGAIRSTARTNFGRVRQAVVSGDNISAASILKKNHQQNFRKLSHLSRSLIAPDIAYPVDLRRKSLSNVSTISSTHKLVRHKSTDYLIQAGASHEYREVDKLLNEWVPKANKTKFLDRLRTGFSVLFESSQAIPTLDLSIKKYEIVRTELPYRDLKSLLDDVVLKFDEKTEDDVWRLEKINDGKQLARKKGRVTVTSDGIDLTDASWNRYYNISDDASALWNTSGATFDVQVFSTITNGGLKTIDFLTINIQFEATRFLTIGWYPRRQGIATLAVKDLLSDTITQAYPSYCKERCVYAEPIPESERLDRTDGAPIWRRAGNEGGRIKTVGGETAGEIKTFWWSGDGRILVEHEGAKYGDIVKEGCVDPEKESIEKEGPAKDKDWTDGAPTSRKAGKDNKEGGKIKYFESTTNIKNTVGEAGKILVEHEVEKDDGYSD